MINFLIKHLGKSGRKYKFGLYCLFVLLSAFIYCLNSKEAEGLFMHFTGAVIAIYVTYTGGNVGSKHVSKKKIEKGTE